MRDAGWGMRGCAHTHLASRTPHPDFPFQDVLPNPGRFRCPGDIEFPRDRIRRRPDGGQQAVERPPPPGERGEETLALEDLELALVHVHRVPEHRLEPISPL